MASAEPSNGCQIAITSCQLCEENEKIQWKCLMCGFLMCSKCQKIHAKFKTSEEHRIVDINEICSYKCESDFKKEQINCEIHDGHICCLYCKDCRRVVCPLCIARNHTKHLLIETSEEHIQNEIKFKVIESYFTDLPCVSNIICCNDGSFWINHYKTHNLQNVKFAREATTKNQSVDLKVYDAALSLTGDLLLCTGGHKVLIYKQETGNNDSKWRKVSSTRYNMKPLIACTIHVSRNNKIMVGVKETGQLLPIAGPRQVIQMDVDGNKEIIHHFDKNKKPIFTFPWRITTDSKNNIYVIDILSEDNVGRIVVLKDDGSVKGIYTGHPSANSQDESFTPRDLAISRSDKVVVTDPINSLFYIINDNAECVKFVDTESDLRISLPMSLVVDHNGLLFVGCGKYDGDAEEARVFVVKCVGI